MSKPCEEIRPELEALLAQMTEGGLDDDGRRRLAAILHDHPDARQVYLDYCQMHALLKSAHGELSAVERPRRLLLPWAVAAAVLLGLLALRFWPASTGARVDGLPVAVGQNIRQGEILYGDGSRVALEDRTETVVYKDRLVLEEGLIRCDVKPRSTPFAIRTPQAEATVLGTSFELGSEKGETRLRVAEGRVRLATSAGAVEAGPGELATSDGRELARWTPLCDLDFRKLRELPPQIETVFCLSGLLHTPGRKIEPALRGRFVPGGFFAGAPEQPHGLAVWRWREPVGDDVLLEVDVAGGERWSLGVSVSGDSFEGYRIIFAVMGYPEGVTIDTIHPQDCVVLAQDPRPIDYARDHTLRVERRGRRMRVWIDRELRIDTEIVHALAEGRRRNFALSNFGAPPVLRGLRVWTRAESP